VLGTNNTFIKEVCRPFPFCQHVVYMHAHPSCTQAVLGKELKESKAAQEHCGPIAGQHFKCTHALRLRLDSKCNIRHAQTVRSGSYADAISSGRQSVARPGQVANVAPRQPGWLTGNPPLPE